MRQQIKGMARSNRPVTRNSVHVLGCSYVEISEVLDIPEKKVKSRLYAGRQLLQERLTQQGLH